MGSVSKKMMGLGWMYRSSIVRRLFVVGGSCCFHGDRWMDDDCVVIVWNILRFYRLIGIWNLLSYRTDAIPYLVLSELVSQSIIGLGVLSKLCFSDAPTVVRMLQSVCTPARFYISVCDVCISD